MICQLSSTLGAVGSALFLKRKGEVLFKWFSHKTIAERWPVPTQNPGTALLGTYKEIQAFLLIYHQHVYLCHDGPHLKHCTPHPLRSAVHPPRKKLFNSIQLYKLV